MDDSFFTYVQTPELIAFFSGYPLLYAVAIFIVTNLRVKNQYVARSIYLLPWSYALVATLYAGLQLKNWYPEYTISHIKQSLHSPWLTAWALLAILFWI